MFMSNTHTVKVYSEDRKTLLGEVSAQTRSPGAAKAAGSLTAFQSKVNGEMAWIAKSYYGYKPKGR